ncbi:hypothetical protein Poly21_17480 [Allorhodopirellula heiligendammensis]|uniref:Uncharacterized protein n=1 Tax=Allorhodopirellula heiligendammensis TaxID=2714739 RepID=A0A5C6C8D1_9BACT|nr:hypothetical protein Poly21_17480 [Allorhodopirellula heiligendammensis]
MTLPPKVERPDFERFEKGIYDPGRIGLGLSRLPPYHVTTIMFGLVSAFAISPWSELHGWMAFTQSFAVMILAFIHSIVVNNTNVKTTHQTRDDPP